MRTRARAHTFARVHEPGWAGSQLQNTFFHSSRSGTPLRSGDWSGRPLLGDARLLRGSDACQSPRAVKTSLPSLSQQSGVEAAAAAAALPGAAAPPSAGRWRVRPAAGVRLRPPSGRARPGLRGRPASRPVPFVWRRAGVCITFRTPPSPFRLSFSLPLTSPSPFPPPYPSGLPASWTKARGRLYPSDVSSPESCRRRRPRAVKQSLAGPPPGAGAHSCPEAGLRCRACRLPQRARNAGHGGGRGGQGGSRAARRSRM